MKEYDIIILGGGPAGLTAGIYAGRYGLKVLIITKTIGGMINYASYIENYPGFEGAGMQLRDKIVKQVKNSNSEILQREITNLQKKDRFFEVRTSRNELFKAKVIILTLGTEKRKLNVKGESKFLGRGVSYCALCDGPLFKDKKVAVIGGANSAAHSALFLRKYASVVYIIYRRDKLKCDSILLKEINRCKNIKIIYNAKPNEIKGEDSVESLVMEKKGKNKEIKVDGVFIEIGSIPTINITKKLNIKTDKEGYIIVDKHMRTNVTGVFAAGDITNNSLKQMIVAAAEGAIAAHSAYKLLKNLK